MKDSVRIGMIGAGHIDHSHAEAWRKEASLIAVASRRIESARSLADRYGIPNVCRDVDELLSRSDVDAVGITTPHHLHHPIALAALKAGKSVFSEKPLALNGSQAREMWLAARRYGAKTGMQSGLRLFPALRILSRLLRDGTAGRVHTFDAHWSFDWARQPDFPLTWRFRQAEAGTGALGDLGVYMIDAARWLVGEISQLNAELALYVTHRPLLTTEDHFGELRRKHREGELDIPRETGQVENDDVCQLLLRFENGARGSIRASRLHQEHTLRVDCERTSYFWQMEGGGGLMERASHDEYMPVSVPATSRDDSIVTTFLNNIHRDEDESPTFRDGLAAQLVIDAAVESNDTGRWVEVKRAR